MTFTISLSMSTITRRALAVSALSVSTDDSKCPLSVDDGEAMKTVSEMILGQIILEMFPFIVKSDFDDDLLTLEVQSARRMSSAEVLAFRITLETAAVAILITVAGDDDSYNKMADDAIRAARRVLGTSMPAGGRMPCWM